jgi:hypothetical protein
LGHCRPFAVRSKWKGVAENGQVLSGSRLNEHQIAPRTVWLSRIAGAKIRAEGARERAKQAVRAADRAEGEAWSIRMEGYFGPAQPSPTIAQCLNSGLGWLEVECKRCKTRASLLLADIRRPGDTSIWKLEESLKCRSCKKGRYAPPVQADRDARDHAVPLGASGRGAMTPWSFKR